MFYSKDNVINFCSYNNIGKSLSTDLHIHVLATHQTDRCKIRNVAVLNGNNDVNRLLSWQIREHTVPSLESVCTNVYRLLSGKHVHNN